MITLRSAAKRTAAAAQQIKGRAERLVGRATGNDQLQARGVVDQTKSNAKHLGARVREVAGKLPSRLRRAA
jgi:uncharacterized protein YjbJ (UPF0337 family)